MKDIRKIILSAVFLAIGIVLPLFTSQIKEIGDTLLPMHLPVMLCGFICGAPYGLLCGIIMPFLRALIFGMPPMYPNAVWMAAELAAYGFFTGFLFARFKRKNTAAVYISLVLSMVFGRCVWGVVKAVLLGLKGKAFTFAAFVSGGIVDAFPGIIIQLVIIPVIIKVFLKKRILTEDEGN